MPTNDSALRLCRHGALLFVLGLVNGALVSALPNGRMGLSAHLAGVQNGTSRVTPIAGAGFEGSVWQEGLVAVLLYSGSAGIFLGAGLVFWGLRAITREAAA